ncbi:MAG: cytochrome c [Nitrospirae bacterium]|nr:cytochrome c [Nitrospirota bacterium]
MHIFLIKSLLAVVLLLLSLVNMMTMFEMFGRQERKFDPETLRKVHRLSGTVFFLLSLGIAYICLDFLVKTKAEPSPRSALHAVFSVAVLFLLSLKVLFNRVYRQFYGRLQTMGLILAFVSTAMISSSAGYFLLVSKFGKETPASRTVEQKKDAVQAAGHMAAKTDPASIERGKKVYGSKCTFCHDPFSNKTLTGPGHKGILKNPLLPVSKKAATPENVAHQLRTPYKDMPSFSSLSDDDVQDVIAYLNTL